MKITGITTILLGLALLFSGCASSPAGPDARGGETLVKTPGETAYHIGVNDEVQVDVWRSPELSVKMPVRPDGDITVPLIGDVKAGGRTPESVAGEIKQRLSKYVREPHVTVIVSELRSHEYLSRVRVTGAVKTPISIPYQPGMTVLDAVLAAGGVNEYAAPNRAMLYRRSGNDKESAMPVRLDRILSSGDLANNLQLHPGDVITVPERFF